MATLCNVCQVNAFFNDSSIFLKCCSINFSNFAWNNSTPANNDGGKGELQNGCILLWSVVMVGVV